ncbi:Small nuclear RNA-activating complex polypeptide 3 [Aphelenchoides fujianensis]|nr:Small nuclear RNA-activating complex polypeptide 3 [Aphelenchoides fujianensis]
MSLERVQQPRRLCYVSPPVDLRKFRETALQTEANFRKFFCFPKSTGGGETADDDEEAANRTSFVRFMEQNSTESPVAVAREVDGALAQIVNQFPIVDFEPTYPPLNSQLATHKVLDDIRKGSSNSKQKLWHVARGRYFKFRPSELERPLKPKRSEAAKDVTLVAHLLRPSTVFNDHNPNHNDYRSLCEVKLQVRGDMPLAKLREKIFCQADFWCGLEDTQDASDQSNYFMNRFPSAYMFIHDTFYIDQSHPNARDITNTAREYMKRKQVFGEHHVKDLNTTKIIDLKLRLGHPYLFLHQGHCEHLMIFTDLRLMHVNDVQDLKDYPVRLYDVIQPFSCCACKEENAAYVITESDRMAANPAYMCQTCFRSFHYDRHTRVGNFTAYHFIDRGGLE